MVVTEEEGLAARREFAKRPPPPTPPPPPRRPSSVKTKNARVTVRLRCGRRRRRGSVTTHFDGHLTDTKWVGFRELGQGSGQSLS